MLRGIDLITQRLLMDYIKARSKSPIEPEYFFEEWMKIHVKGDTEKFRGDVWKGFIRLLKDVG